MLLWLLVVTGVVVILLKFHLILLELFEHPFLIGDGSGCHVGSVLFRSGYETYSLYR